MRLQHTVLPLLGSPTAALSGKLLCPLVQPGLACPPMSPASTTRLSATLQQLDQVRVATRRAASLGLAAAEHALVLARQAVPRVESVAAAPPAEVRKADTGVQQPAHKRALETADRGSWQEAKVSQQPHGAAAVTATDGNRGSGTRRDGKVGQVAKVTRLFVVLVRRSVRTTGLVYTGCVLADKVDAWPGWSSLRGRAADVRARASN